MDIFHPRARRLGGLTLVSLDRLGDPPPGVPADAWRQWLAEDNRVSPADEAAFRLDFAAWLAVLPPRKRQAAELLVAGHETGAVANGAATAAESVAAAATVSAQTP